MYLYYSSVAFHLLWIQFSLCIIFCRPIVLFTSSVHPSVLSFLPVSPFSLTVTFSSLLKSPLHVPCPSSHTVTLQIILLTAAWTSVWRLYSKLLFRHIITVDNPEKKNQVSFNLRTYQTGETIPCRSGLWLLPKKCCFLWRVSIVRRQKCWTSLERRLESEKMRIFT